MFASLAGSTKLLAAQHFGLVAVAGGLTPVHIVAVLALGWGARILAALAPAGGVWLRARGYQALVCLLCFGFYLPKINERKLRREFHTRLVGARGAALLR